MAHIDVGNITATEGAGDLVAFGHQVGIGGLICRAEMLLDPDLAVPRRRCDEAAGVKSDHLVVDIDVADGVNFVTSQHDDLVQIAIICASCLIVGDSPALAHLSIHEVVR